MIIPRVPVQHRRLLPDLDIEGDRLLSMLNQEADATDRLSIKVRN